MTIRPALRTYAQAGAAYGYATLWTTLLMLPMMSAVPYISAKVGIVSGKGLAGALREHYPRAVLYPAVLALIVANTINAGADIGAIAAAINLLPPIPAIAGRPRDPRFAASIEAILERLQDRDVPIAEDAAAARTSTDEEMTGEDEDPHSRRQPMSRG